MKRFSNWGEPLSTKMRAEILTYQNSVRNKSSSKSSDSAGVGARRGGQTQADVQGFLAQADFTQLSAINDFLVCVGSSDISSRISSVTKSKSRSASPDGRSWTVIREGNIKNRNGTWCGKVESTLSAADRDGPTSKSDNIRI